MSQFDRLMNLAASFIQNQELKIRGGTCILEPCLMVAVASRDHVVCVSVLGCPLRLWISI